MTKFKIGENVRIIQCTGEEFDRDYMHRIGNVISIDMNKDYPYEVELGEYFSLGFKEDELESAEYGSRESNGYK